MSDKQERTPVQHLLSDALSGTVDRRTLLRRAAALGISAPMFGALLAACGGDSGSDTPAAATTGSGGDSGSSSTTTTGGSSSTATTGGATPEATSASSGGAGGTEVPEKLVVMQGVDANTLDPLLRNSTPEFNINLHVFDMFLKRDPKTLEIKPGIVEKWQNIDDNTWEFTLVKGAKFHNGDPVDSDAAIFSFDRANKKTVGDKPIVNNIDTQIHYDSGEKVDDLTFRIKTTEPAAIFPDLLTTFEIVPPSVYKDESPDTIAANGKKPIGSGPYTFTEWVKDDHITLDANPDYWQGAPKIKQVIFRPVPELSARTVALQNGEANIIVNVTPDLVDQIDKSDKGRVSKVTGGRIIFVGIRCDKPPFTDKRVRQALNYSVDFDSISKALLAGNGERAATIVNPPHQNKALKPYPYDPEKAKALLKEAGVDSSLEITMDGPSGRYLKDAEMSQALAQGWQDIGLKVNLKVLEWSLYAGTLIPSGDLDPLFFLGLGSPFSGQQEIFYVHPDYSLNFTRWQNDDFVAKYAKLGGTIDPEQRQQLMDELQQIIYDDCPWVPIWHQVDFYGATKDMGWEARADENIFALDVAGAI